VNSRCTRRFWKLHGALPARVQTLAKKNYELWRRDHGHPSLDFKKLKGGSGNRFSVRVGDHHRAIGHLVGDTVEWVWIGTHEEYNGLI
jgi:hypothetical protein